MRLRPFTPKEPIPDVQTTSEWEPDPEVVLKHDGLYARAWESDFEKLISDDGQDKPGPPNPLEVVVEFEHTHAETCRTRGTERENSPEIFPSTEEICNGGETYPYTEHDEEMSFEKHNPIHINPCSSKNDLDHDSEPCCIDNCRYRFPNIVSVMFQFMIVLPTEHVRTRSGNI